MLFLWQPIVSQKGKVVCFAFVVNGDELTFMLVDNPYASVIIAVWVMLNYFTLNQEHIDER